MKQIKPKVGLYIRVEVGGKKWNSPVTWERSELPKLAKFDFAHYGIKPSLDLSTSNTFTHLKGY